MGCREYVPPRRLDDVPTETLLGVSFQTCLKRRRDMLMGRHGDVSLRHLGDVSPRLRWLFRLRRTFDVNGTYRETLWRFYRVLLLDESSFMVRLLFREEYYQKVSSKMSPIIKKFKHTLLAVSLVELLVWLIFRF